MEHLLRYGFVLASLALAGGAGAVTPAEKCQAGKLKLAGKYDFCRLKAEAKAAQSGGAPDFSKCDAGFAGKWGKTEAAGGGMCPSNGDQAAIQAFIGEYTDALATALAGGGLPPPVQQCNDELTTCTTDLDTCETDLVAAELCGNGAIDGGEQCDLGTLNGATCATEGYVGGVLRCGSGCVFDTSGCWNARFADNADGTVTDNQSGLQWEKKVKLDYNPDFANPHDADNYYPWSGTCTVNTSKFCQPAAAAATLCAANAEGGTTGCDECTGGDGTCNQSTTIWTWAADLNSANFAGHNDWRVPRLQELQGILDYADTTPPVVDVAFDGGSCGVACADITNAACSCTRSSHHWSATTSAPDPLYVWLPSFGHGYVDLGGRTSSYYVRAVRSGS
ncbi:DUF1566 domain-containing protein [bacterium]|nr:DUF1566 domain-containing protein [bacterium]